MYDSDSHSSFIFEHRGKQCRDSSADICAQDEWERMLYFNSPGGYHGYDQGGSDRARLQCDGDDRTKEERFVGFTKYKSLKAVSRLADEQRVNNF